MDLNFKSLAMAFLWRDHPIVIKMMASMFTNGCSKEVKRSSASSICPSDSKPFGDRKYNTKPITS